MGEPELKPMYKICNFRAPGALYIIFFCLLLASCSTPKRSQYFDTITKDTTISGFVTPDFEAKVQPGDNLGISINSLSTEEDAKFNSTIVSEGASTSVSVPSYLVSPAGTIKMYRLGEIKVEGLTRRELAEKLQQDLSPYLKNPLVNISFLNHKVTVMGAVTSPQVINMPEESITLLEALARSGNITKDGKKSNVMIVRETGTEKQMKMVNLEDHSIFTSPWYHLRPNDIVYVRSDFEREDRDEKRRRLQTTVSLVVSAVSFFIIIIERLLR